MLDMDDDSKSLFVLMAAAVVGIIVLLAVVNASEQTYAASGYSTEKRYNE